MPLAWKDRYSREEVVFDYCLNTIAIPTWKLHRILFAMQACTAALKMGPLGDAVPHMGTWRTEVFRGSRILGNVAI